MFTWKALVGMGFSALQKAMLRQCYPLTGRVDRVRFHGLREAGATRAHDVGDAVTKSIERLIDRGLLIGYGIRTKEKWFIKDVRLTPEGRRAARKVAGEQQALPLRELRIRN